MIDSKCPWCGDECGESFVCERCAGQFPEHIVCVRGLHPLEANCSCKLEEELEEIKQAYDVMILSRRELKAMLRESEELFGAFLLMEVSVDSLPPNSEFVTDIIKLRKKIQEVL